MARASNLTMCSFCGKSHSEVRKLIAGPGVYICDSCIVVCKNILDKEINEDSESQISDVSAFHSQFQCFLSFSVVAFYFPVF